METCFYVENYGSAGAVLRFKDVAYVEVMVYEGIVWRELEFQLCWWKPILGFRVGYVKIVWAVLCSVLE